MSEPDDPFDRFQYVFDLAVEAGIKNLNAMTLSSVDAGGQPSSRQVLLKGFGREGFVFYTNLESRKGREILANPQVALNFYWRELDRQINVRGEAIPVSDEEADAYFQSRDRGSQLGAWASQQSRPLASRSRLLMEVASVESRHVGGPVPRPPHWSGFRVVPKTFDFWKAGRFRLHDREIYERSEGGWERWRAYP